MLIKEYRILLPLTVNEYRIAQLYMIQKKSRQESSGEGSGVEIITNKPYSDGPGGFGQYTFKIYHIGNKIPVWLRSVLPTNALEAHEEAWNAYPHTKTRYSSPFLDRFNIEVETKYYNDAGNQENVFELTGDELKNRIVDVMDFVNDALSSYDYVPDEDPKLYHSIKTGRGPLKENWIDDCIKNGKPIMCAYKLCRVEFRFWGLQTRAERWIHSHALRNTMLRAHKQAWVWQDEWHDLTLEDVRELERDAAEHLSKLMSRSSISVSSSIYFDCMDGNPMMGDSQSLIKWSSEISLNSDHETLLSPRLEQNMKVVTNTTSDASLLVIVFYGDIFSDVSTDQNVSDPNSLRLTMEKQISTDFEHLKGHVHFLQVSCGQEFTDTALHLISITPTYGLVHPSLALLLSSSQYYFEAVRNTLHRANEAYNQFMHSNAGRNFNGEIFAVGDYLGGILLHECLKHSANHCHMQQSHQIVSRHSSNLSTKSHIIANENRQEFGENAWMTNVNKLQRNSSVPLTMKFRNCPQSTPNSETSLNDEVQESLVFHPSMTFLLGCPLAFVLIHRKFHGYEAEPLECNQLFNIYYSIDACGARLEPVLNPQLAMLLPVNVPRYSGTADVAENNDGILDSSLLWGNHRIDHILHSPHAMITLPSSALPNVLHASYWENDDVAAFILKRFLQCEGVRPINLASITKIPSEIKLGPAIWNKKRTKYKIANLAPSFSGNDVICVEGIEQVIHARFCYGPMDLVALSRENIFVYIRPAGGDWQLVKTDITDSHGKITFELKKRLSVGIHHVKLIVHGDHSFLDLYVAVAPVGEQFVVFSVDGSLTASVSVTGRDPRVRPGVVDVVRYWHDLGYTIIYITARPDMQHKVVALWLALHNFPHGLLIFTPSFSTDPLRQKVLHLKNYLEMGLFITAAYGSSKDVSVYSSAGVKSNRIFSVTGGKRGCTNINCYASHLKDLNEGLYDFVKPFDSSLIFPQTNSSSILNRRNLIRRTDSFNPRSGRQLSEKSRLL
ncbi:retinal degeneration b protein [Wuchereria bancrofti]|uniref:Retinal degeneration b protein n=1 Tax=Wuchereria bancrofti TaxID=6293 RepID=J9F1S2_WUCBA|nr:retinal degeneration b protein [Wuchereria bancrofti]